MDGGALLERFEREWPLLEEALALPYAGLGAERAARFRERLVDLMVDAWATRPAELRALDDAREREPDWFQRPEMIGYATYVDRFAGTLRGVGERIGYLEELGVRYLHLMPLLRTREGPNDGGYAVSDYRSVNPKLGSMDDLRWLAGALRARRISLCIDLVMNHVAREHPWAQRAAAGDPDAEAMFHIFPDRTWPDRYEASLPEVFPAFAPGSFSQLPDGRWVWTTFNDYQWDLNWANPDVFAEMLDILLFLANVGVEVIRLDAVAFTWKRLGTDCQNQPEAHALLRALRACTAIAAPAMAHKAEAIVSPDDLIPYLGSGSAPESDLAYHNSLMVQYWAALAPADTGLMLETLSRFPDHPPTTAWATYLRCHDDIGWAVTDEIANAVGIADAGAHRRWLADFYAGRWPGSFARGANFQENDATGDRRTSGTTASLAGLERARERNDPDEIELALRRILLGHALIYGYDGLPIVWMGDEIGLPNDHWYLADPALADDNRWMHRPPMDWAAADRRLLPGTIEERLFRALRRLGAARAATPHLHASVPLEVVDAANRRLFAFVRRDPRHGPLLALHNFSPEAQAIDNGWLRGWFGRDPVDRLSQEPVALGSPAEIPGYGAIWLTAGG
jgi:amylosucrase